MLFRSKTKPTQHSVQELRRIGIQPDAIVCRSDGPLSQDVKDKIALACDVAPQAVVAMPTLPDIYAVPLLLEQASFGELICDELGLQSRVRPIDMRPWEAMVGRLGADVPPIEIALVGKYVQLHDAYLSVTEALRHAAAQTGRRLQVRWVNSEELEHEADRKSTRLNSSHSQQSRMPSSA